MLRALLAPFVVATALAAGSVPTLAAELSKVDRDYLSKDASGAAYELALARLAADKASRDDVKAYARKLVADHDGYNAALQALGKAKGVDLPTAMDTADAVKLAALKALSGSLFDRAFLEEQARVNGDDVDEAEKEKAATADPDVKAFVAKGAAMDSDHRMLAKSLSAAK